MCAPTPAAIPIAPLQFGAVGKKGSIALIERLWRTLKDTLGLRLLRPLVAEDLMEKVEIGLVHYAHFRPHQRIGGATPAEIYFRRTPAHLSAIPPPRGRPGEGPMDPPLRVEYLDAERLLPVLIREAALREVSKVSEGVRRDRGVRSWHAYDDDTTGLGSSTGIAIPIAPLHGIRFSFEELRSSKENFMKALRFFACLSASVLSIAAATPALGLASRVFVSARSGNNANSCDNLKTPCQTFAGAVTQLNLDGVVIVLDSGDYGAVTITQGVTIEAPTGVTAFIQPPWGGDAITVNAGAGTVTLRGLVLNGLGWSNGITVTTVGTLNVENCFITGFTNGIQMNSADELNVKGTDIKVCTQGVHLANSTGTVRASLDHCHLDENTSVGFYAGTTTPGSSTTTATYSTANNNFSVGWLCGSGTTGKDVLNLEFCTGSENGFDGLAGSSVNAQSVARYSNCVFANNGSYGVERLSSGTVETRRNNTVTGNGIAPTHGIIGSFLPM